MIKPAPKKRSKLTNDKWKTVGLRVAKALKKRVDPGVHFEASVRKEYVSNRI